LLAWPAICVATLAVEIPLAIVRFNDPGILLLDGDPAAGAGVDALGAALQPITHPAYIFVSASLLALAVLTAALGAMAVRAAGRTSPG
jgi:hypothetical protein